MTKHANIPPIIESDENETRDSGVESTVAIAGHPLHPVIVTFPIAFLVGALGTDIGYWITGDPFWARASLWLVGVGLAGGVLAAITGMSDFIRIGRVRERTAGWAHMILNVLVLGLTIVNLILRLNDPVDAILPWGLAISVVVGALLGASGWFGGELVYRHKVSVIGYGSNHRP